MMADNNFSLYLAMSLRTFLWVLLILTAASPAAQSQSEPHVIEAGKFSAAAPGDTPPHGWKHATFKKIKQHTRYSLVLDEGRIVVRAISRRSASLLTRAIGIDPKQYPVIEWQWKAANTISKGDIFKKRGDDCPARLFITFAGKRNRAGLSDKEKYKVQQSLFGGNRRLRAINYIWANKAAVGTIVPNKFSERVVMFVVRSGAHNLNKWQTERRNVYEDYKKAFGEEPPMISGIAIMTDSDNTGESATAFYGDIKFKKSIPTSRLKGPFE